MTPGGIFSLEWSSVAGKTYNIEFAADPSAPTATWVLVDVVIGTGGTDTLVGALPVLPPTTGFLRVRVEE